MHLKKTSPAFLLLAYTAIYFIWGTTYLANLYGLKGLPPFILSCFRYLLAASLLSGFIFVKNQRWPDRKDVKTLSISGILMLVGGSGLVVYAEKYVNSGYAAIMVATEPIWFIILDRKNWKLYFSNPGIIAGICTGFAGILLFAWFSPHTGKNDNHVAGTVILLLSALLWVTGTLYGKRKVTRPIPVIAGTTVQLLAAGLFAGSIALIRGEWFTLSLPSVPREAWEGLIYLVVMGSVVAYLAFTWLITVQPAALVSTHTYINPVIALLIGRLVAQEQVALKQLLATLLILSGVMLAQFTIQKISKEQTA